jgi:Protochlamydia outer membrane protein
MRKWIFSLLIVVPHLFSSSLHAKNCKLDGGAGYRQDKFQWELAGPDNVPKVMSRLTWEDLRIFELQADFKKITCQNLYFRASGDYGWIFDGKNKDADFAYDSATHRTIEYSRSDNKANCGQVYDASAGLGYFYRWCFGVSQMRFAPVGGYAYHAQNLHMYDGYQSIDLDNPNFEGHHFHDLNSTYRARWYGPWVGVDLYYHINDCLTITGSFEYQWLQYHARGHWNLRQDILGDFHHRGFGRGYFTTVGIDYNFCAGWYIGALLKFDYSHLHNGKDRTVVGIPIDANEIHARKAKKLRDDAPLTFPGNGGDSESESSPSSSSSSPAVIPFDTEGKLRSVKWLSFSAIFTVAYNF